MKFNEYLNGALTVHVCLTAYGGAKPSVLGQGTSCQWHGGGNKLFLGSKSTLVSEDSLHRRV